MRRCGAVVIPAYAILCCLMPCGGRTSPVVCTHRVAARASWSSPPSPLSAWIDPGPVCGPQAHDTPQLSPTGGPEGGGRCRACAPRGLATEGVGRGEPQAEGVGRAHPAGRAKAAGADLHATGRANRWEEPPEPRHGVEGGGAEAGTAGCTRGAGDATLLARDEAAMGDGASADRGGEVGERCRPIGIGLAGDVPRKNPGLGGDVRQPPGLAQVCFEESAGDGGEGGDGDQDGGAGRPPTTAVLRQSTAGANGVNGGGLELSPPGVPDTEQARPVGAKATLVLGAPFEGLQRGVDHRLGGEAWRCADTGA
jgi:hypothetical protein